ncbi:MAG TPA: DUF4097 family beta strand repeat-containing protein [Solirubrobacteraceae bacterium]
MPESWKLEQPDQVALGEGVRSLRLFAAAGRVNLIGTDGPATLEVTRISGQPLYVELSDTGELVVRHGEHNKPQLFNWLFGGKRVDVELSLALPPDTLLDVRVLSGPVVVSNFHERVAVKGVSGEVTLAGVHGAARVTTISGAITAEQVTGDLTVKAVSGAITVIAGAGGSIDLAAVSGAIAVDLEDPVPSTARLQCVSGAMTVRLPHDPDVRVDLGTANGRAVSSFPEVRASGSRGSQKLSGTIGAGTATLVGKTVSGSVTLLRRSADEEPWDLVIDDQTPQDETPQSATPQDQIPDGTSATPESATPDSTTTPDSANPGSATPHSTTPDNGENSEDAR